MACSSEHTRYLCSLHRWCQHSSNLCSKIYVANVGVSVGNVKMKRALVMSYMLSFFVQFRPLIRIQVASFCLLLQHRHKLVACLEFAAG